jgi:hypothetical protein
MPDFIDRHAISLQKNRTWQNCARKDSTRQDLASDPLQYLWDTWEALRCQYEEAGSPFGPTQRGLELWVHYDGAGSIQ